MERASGVRNAGAPANLGSPGPAIGWASCPEEVGMLVEDLDTQEVEELVDEDVDELLVEEVSIDGMCGVY
jgi:mycofactocin precursor